MNKTKEKETMYFTVDGKSADFEINSNYERSIIVNFAGVLNDYLEGRGLHIDRRDIELAEDYSTDSKYFNIMAVLEIDDDEGETVFTIPFLTTKENLEVIYRFEKIINPLLDNYYISALDLNYDYLII